ncbi:phospholipase A1 member A-like isoform X1 [Epargyreus clarus]|uniref:phospholipase A1 member A-like isoform X1 n=1 Tax=Epargyreus clarus TaxID=520877 RepID=UPI003C2F2EE9
MLLKNILLCTFLLASDVTSLYSSKEMEGYPNGYLSDCVGSNKLAIIKPKTLEHLTLSVQTPGNALTGKRRRYTYYQMKELAQDPDVDFSKKTMLFVGGYLDTTGFVPSAVMGSEYKGLGYTVLLLDTNWFTTFVYPVAVRYMRPVGKHVAEMLVELGKYGLDPKKLEVIGESLGGQTMSFIAKNYKKMTNVTIGRLTGLDPAGPCFRHYGPEDRLDKSDADFVQTVHSNIDGLGIATPVGHVSFYINGGEHQPGDIIWLYCNLFCSHVRAYTVWLSALSNPKQFIAIQCDSVQQARERNCYDRQPQVTNILGLDTDQSKPGIYYLSTYNGYPFYLGKKGLKREYDFELSRMKMFNEKDVIEV